MRKKLLTLLLACAAVFALLTISASAADSSDVTYEETDGVVGVTITGCNPEASGALVIHEELDGHLVAKIGDSAFSGCSKLTSITLPDYYITDIGAGAFRNCAQLERFVVPVGISRINSETFYGCENMTSITIPKSVGTIGANAFALCDALTDVYYYGTEQEWNEVNILSGNLLMKSADIHFYDEAVANPLDYLTYSIADDQVTITGCDSSVFGVLIIPKTIEGYPVTAIGDFAIRACPGLMRVEIPASVTSIGRYQFERCTYLVAINVDPDNEYYSSNDGVLMNASGSELIRCPEGNQDFYFIPNGVTQIDSEAFMRCSFLDLVVIPEGVTVIPQYMCYGCEKLTRVIIPESISEIGRHAFMGCKKLNKVVIPDGVTEIPMDAFSGCQSLTTINIPDTVTLIGKDAFEGCSKLKNITIPDSVTTIDYWAFASCTSLEEIVIPDSVEWLSQYVFAGCTNLKTATLSSNMPTIMFGLFENCSSLRSVIIPSSITSIYASAFDGCTALQDIYYCGTRSEWDAITVNNGDPFANVTIHYEYSPVSITAQPINYAGAVNSTAKFSLAASGDGLKYQWQYSDDNGATWLESSLKSATYSAKLTTEKDERMVRCIVTDAAGNAVISDPAVMRISNLKITAQPKDYTGAVNSTAKFTVAASGDGLKYQWQYSDDNGATWLASTIQKATYSAKLTADKDGRMVRCVVTDQHGVSVTSSAAKMTRNGPTITIQPKDYVGAVNSTAKFTVTVSGDGLKYQWQYSDDNGKTWLASSIKSATYSAKFAAEKNNRTVRCIVTDASGNTVTSNAAKMTLSAPVITAQPQNYVGAVNSTAKFTVTATGNGLTYKWQYSDDNGATWLASSLKSAAYSAKFTAEKNNRMVRCIVTDANGNSVTSNAVSMRIG